ncbi:MAG: YbaN family protein [Spirochaetales bacterium]|nr:YbaN family protein [Spirochaetales bacterium]
MHKNSKNENSDVQKYSNKFIRVILILLGTISVLLGLIGIVLPLLPTTPFLLLGAAIYAKSSDKFYSWLIENRLFGSYIKNYREGKGIPLKVKISAISFLWITILITAIFFIPIPAVKILLIIIATAVTFHIVKIP